MSTYLFYVRHQIAENYSRFWNFTIILSHKLSHQMWSPHQLKKICLLSKIPSSSLEPDVKLLPFCLLQLLRFLRHSDRHQHSLFSTASSSFVFISVYSNTHARYIRLGESDPPWLKVWKYVSFILISSRYSIGWFIISISYCKQLHITL